jgi:5-methylcytosine-specific restriction endonuclease McrA
LATRKTQKSKNYKEWTEARFKSFVTSALRTATRKWPPKYEALKAANVGRRLDKATGKLSYRYKCAGCGKAFKQKDVQVDHIFPVVDPQKGFTNWDEYIDRMFCDVEHLQVLCTECHSVKTQNEREERKNASKAD